MQVFFEPVILSQHVDTLVTTHKSINESDYNGKFQKFCSILEEHKEAAQNIKSEGNRFVVAELLGLGRFRVYPKGNHAYKYHIENDDMYIKIGDIKFGADRPQITIEYRQSFLFALGHKRAYEIASKFVDKAMGVAKPNITRIDLATDVWGVAYEYQDAGRFQTNFRRTEISDNDLFMFKSVARRTLETFTFGKGAFMFRIYDKCKQLAHYPEKKALLLPKWILNGYEEESKVPVFRHEIQLKDDHLKKHIPSDCSDKVLHVFANLQGLWHYALDRIKFVDLTKNELERVSRYDADSATVRQIYHRAKKDDNRFHFWPYLKYWDNVKVSQTLTYKEYKESKIQTAHKAAKMFLSSVYKVLGDDPKNLLAVLDSVNDETVKFKGITAHQAAQLKIVDSFVANERLIVNHGVVAPAVHEVNFYQAQKAYFDVISQVPEEVKKAVNNRAFELAAERRLNLEAMEVF